MSYFSQPLLDPQPDECDQPFWKHIRDGWLHFQYCEDCSSYTHPPMLHCARCGSSRRSWRPAPSTGTLFTYTIVYRASHPAVLGNIPYNIVVVEFPECGGVRLVTNIVDMAGDFRIGMPLEIFMDKDQVPWVPRARVAPAMTK